MKIKTTHLLIAAATTALIIVLIIQVAWVFRTAQIKEELFNEKATIVLAKTAEALSSDTATCQRMETCIGENEINTTDSLFSNYMNFYNFHPAYDLKVGQIGNYTNKSVNNSYTKRIAEQSNLELNLTFPQKNKFILEEMAMMLVTSAILILIVLALFWHTVRSLIQEKLISEHTNEFLNNMTHEFNTPLTNIALAGKMLSKELKNSDQNKLHHYTTIILEENEKLRLQTDQVLSMTALERGQIPLLKTQVDIHQIIQDAGKCIDMQLTEKKGSFRFELLAEKHLVEGDKTFLTQALVGLFENAIKYTPAKPVITVRTSNGNGNIYIEIRDNGIGIAKEYQAKVFEKYFRVPTGDIHNTKGFGLGLAFIKKIVALHSGEITLQSELHSGSSFTIQLPNG